MIKVIIADDHPVVLEGIKSILGKNTMIDLVAEASSGNQVMNLCNRFLPDVVVLDISMPGPNILELICIIKATHPSIKILILSIHSEERYIIRTIKAGASGYLTKNKSPEMLVKAILDIHNKNSYISPDVYSILLNEISSDKKRGDIADTLSPRELEVLKYLGTGTSVKQIAGVLGLNPATVNTYKYRIMNKLNIANTNELIRIAVEYNQNII